MVNSPRLPQDVNRAFDEEIKPCRCGKCGDMMRFELEIEALADDHRSDQTASVLVISWRYGLNVDATLRYFDALAGFRRKQ